MTHPLITKYNQLVEVTQEFSSKPPQEEPVVNHIITLIQDLKSLLVQGFTPETLLIKTDIKKTFKKITTSCIDHPTTSPLHNKIVLMNQLVLHALSLVKKEFHQKDLTLSKIDISFVYICDAAGPDENLAMMPSVENCLLRKIPFITSRSILTCACADAKYNYRISRVLDIESLLQAHYADWDIFQQNDIDHGEELVVFIPKNLFSTKIDAEKFRRALIDRNNPEIIVKWPSLDSDKEQLSLLDLNGKTLKRISSLSTILQYPTKASYIEGFQHLFLKKSKLNKFFMLIGHGDLISAGGLSAEEYVSFIHFLGKQKCKALRVSSCYAGGYSSLLNLKQNKFPILIASIGDYETYPEHEDDYAVSLTHFTTAGPRSITRLRKLLEAHEPNLAKSMSNYLQISNPIPSGGLLPICENGLGFTITFAGLKRLAFESVKTLQIAQKEFLHIYPAVIPMPIIFSIQDPYLLSAIPGTARHFIHSIQLEKTKPIEFVENQIEESKQLGLAYSKAYFIGTLSFANSQWNEVSIRLSSKHNQYVYRRKDEYYYGESICHTQIHPLEHAIFCRQLMQFCKPTSEALSTAIIGQEPAELFEETMQTSEFWKQSNPYFELLNQLDKNLDADPDRNIFDFPEIASLNKKELKCLIFYLIKNRYEKQALQLFDDNKLDIQDVNVRDFKDQPLIFAAVYNQCHTVVAFLLTKQIQLQIFDPVNQSYLLHVAIEFEELNLIEAILALPQNELDLEYKNSKGQTAIFIAAKMLNEPLVQELKKRGAFVSRKNENEESWLESLIKEEKQDAAFILIDAGTDLNAGISSPLNCAICKNDLILIQYILLQGNLLSEDSRPDPFKKDNMGQVPIIEAASRGQFDVVELFLESEDLDIDVLDDKGINPLLAALLSNHLETIDILKKAGASFPYRFSLTAKHLLETYIKRLKINGIETREIRQNLTSLDPTNAILTDMLEAWLSPDSLCTHS